MPKGSNNCSILKKSIVIKVIKLFKIDLFPLYVISFFFNYRQYISNIRFEKVNQKQQVSVNKFPFKDSWSKFENDIN